MSRKSRKNTQELNFATNKTTNKTYSVGIYVRLSRFDNNKIDNCTIENQKNIILDYIKDKEEFKLFSIYEDNNYSGTNFNRSGFEKLLEDIRNGKINCIIVKDLSRFGRNYIECGNYLEKIFPFIDVRFIAINDNYDSNNENSAEILLMHLKNIVNEVYAKDISKKICSAIREKQKKGDFIGSWASYGYLKDKENKNKLVIDEESSKIVKYIFDLRLQGYSYTKIAIKLNEENILSPNAYFYKIGILKNEKYQSGKWSYSTVNHILSNEVYLGSIIQRKTQITSIKSENRKRLEKEKWEIVENTHEPIISKDIFYKVQEINNNAKEIYNKNNATKLTKKPTENIFKGLVKCGECHKKLVRREMSKKTKNCIRTDRFFSCKSKALKQCDFNHIKEDLIKEIIFKEVKKQIQTAKNLQNFIIKNNDIILLEQAKFNSKLENIKIEISKIQNFYKIIYEDYVTGLLDEEEYIFIKNEYMEKETELKEKQAELENKLSNLTHNLSKENKYLKEFLKFKNSKVLTKRLIEILIKEIIIYKDKTVQITFNYMNDYNQMINEIERSFKDVI